MCEGVCGCVGVCCVFIYIGGIHKKTLEKGGVDEAGRAWKGGSEVDGHQNVKNCILASFYLFFVRIIHGLLNL